MTLCQRPMIQNRVLVATVSPAIREVAIGSRSGAATIAISSTKDRTVSFDLVDFYHNSSRLAGVDTMKLTGAEIANVMNQLQIGFQEGHLQAPEITAWAFDRAIEAYKAVEKGGTSAKHILILDAVG